MKITLRNRILAAINILRGRPVIAGVEFYEAKILAIKNSALRLYNSSNVELSVLGYNDKVYQDGKTVYDPNASPEAKEERNLWQKR